MAWKTFNSVVSWPFCFVSQRLDVASLRDSCTHTKISMTWHAGQCHPSFSSCLHIYAKPPKLSSPEGNIWKAGGWTCRILRQHPGHGQLHQVIVKSSLGLAVMWWWGQKCLTFSLWDFIFICMPSCFMLSAVFSPFPLDTSSSSNSFFCCSCTSELSSAILLFQLTPPVFVFVFSISKQCFHKILPEKCVCMCVCERVCVCMGFCDVSRLLLLQGQNHPKTPLYLGGAMLHFFLMAGSL